MTEPRKLLEVGDVVVVENCLRGKTRYPITRVTKTIGFSELAVGHQVKFQREISYNMAYPKDIWNMNKYTVICKED